MRTLGEFERAVLLAVIRLDDDAYGVSIRRELEDLLLRNVSLGAVYTTLERLQEKGHVTSYTGAPTPQRGGRAKKFFTIQPSGRKALDRARRSARVLEAFHPAKGAR